MEINFKPVITAIIPTFERPQYLKRALESILSQTYTNFIVCIYDNSSDSRTEEIVKAFAENDKRVSYHRHKENIGATPNFEFGLNQVSTPYFSFLSDDDVLFPNFYETALNGFKKHPEAGFFCGTIIWSDSHGKILNVTTSSWDAEFYEPPNGLFQMIPNHLDWMGILFKKEVRDRIGGIDTRVKSIDLDYLIRSAAEFSFIVSKVPCGVFFQHPKSYSYYAGSKVIWPSYLYILENLRKSLNLSSNVISKAECLIKKDLQKKITLAFISSLKKKDYTDSFKTIAVLKDYLSRPILSSFLWILVKILQNTLYLHTILLYALKFRKLLIKRNQSLQNAFGRFLEGVQFVNHD